MINTFNDYFSELDKIFTEETSKAGYDYWYDSEEIWEDIAKIMIKKGYKKKLVKKFFDFLSEEL